MPSLPEREVEVTQERTGLFVGLRRGGDDDVHAPDRLGLVVVDLGEHQVLLDPERVVAAPVEGLRVQAAEVANARQRDRDEAIRKATDAAKRAMIRVSLREGRTLHHDVQGRHGAGKVVLRAAPQGTGIIAGGPMRAVFEAVGMQDVVSKSLGSSNPYNLVRATFNALKNEDSPRSVAARRGLKVLTLQSRRRISDGDGAGADS